MAVTIDVELTRVDKEDVSISLNVAENMKNGNSILLELVNDPKVGIGIVVEQPQGNLKNA